MRRGVIALFGGQSRRSHRLSTHTAPSVHTSEGFVHSYPQPCAQVWKFILRMSLSDGQSGRSPCPASPAPSGGSRQGCETPPVKVSRAGVTHERLSLIHISEPTRL